MNSLNPLEPRKKKKLYIFHYTRDPYFMAYENNPFHNWVRFHQQQIPEKTAMPGPGFQLLKEMAISWVVPPPSNSHHQDCYVFSRGSQPKPSFATGILGGGSSNPSYVTLRTWLPKDRMKR